MKKIALLYVFFIILLFFPAFAHGAIPPEERAALIALYNAADGHNWERNSGWKTPPLHTDGFAMPGTEDDWYGISLSDNHVSSIGLWHNNLEGNIPTELGNLSNLRRLDLDMNKLSGRIPHEIGNLGNLRGLSLGLNELTGNIPPELGNLIYLERLELIRNQLTGTIPSELGNLINLEWLELDNNQLTGTIPSELGNLTKLKWLDLEFNQLTGAIPPEFGNMSRLYHLDLNNNQLTGLPPEFSNLGNLEYCRLNHNRLTGNIPPELGNMTQLMTLYLNNNQLTGSIPPELGNLTRLYQLHLNDNQLTGNIPGGLVDLNVDLQFNSNKLTGELPSNLISYKGAIDIRYNGLYTNNPGIRMLLNEINKGWEDTQTITPANVSALTVSPSSIKISWSPILYQDDTGRYEIYSSTTSGSAGTWTYAGSTDNKSALYFLVSGLNPGTTYFFLVRTITDPHSNNINSVISEYSDEVSAATDSTTLSCVLTVQSTPSNGVTIDVTPIDNNGQGNGITKFTRTYYKGTAVFLTAPETYKGKNFLKWTVDAIDNTNRTLEITVYDNYEIIAVYGQSNVQITVTTTEDFVPGSLRDAITTANASSKDTTIILPTGTYYLYGADKEDNNQSGDLDINTLQHISIVGEDAETTIIDASKLDRVLDIFKGSVSITGVTIRNGKTFNGETSCDGGYGGGIKNSGSLTLIKCFVKNNEAGNGGNGPLYSFTIPAGNGGDGGGIYNSGSLTLEKCIIENNSAGCGGSTCYGIDGDGGHGGGIYSEGTQLLIDCIIRDNTAGCGGSSGCDSNNGGSGGDGGGVFNSGRQTIKNCRIIDNCSGSGSYTEDGKLIRGGHGGGVFNKGEKSSISNTVIVNNATGITSGGGDGGYGGGVYNEGNMALDHSTVNYNTTGYGIWGSGGNGGGVCNKNVLFITDSSVCFNITGYGDFQVKGGSGGGIYNSQSLTLKNCNVSNNKTGSGGCSEEGDNGGNGGGICNVDNGSAILKNCTISTNITGKGSDGFSHYKCGNGGFGGGIYNTKTLDITNSTICNNETGEGGNGKNETEDGKPGNGGGIYNSNDYGTGKVKNTIVANNKAASGGEGPDCYGDINSQGYNLIEDTSHCKINGILTGNITGVDPMLGPLADNGGPTQTHALLSGSPAIDAGNSIGISKDQRGYPRPVDIPEIPNLSDGSDIGAYELNLTNFIIISGKITCNGIGLVGVNLTFSNNGGTAAADQNGNYTHYVPSGWTGTVTPKKEGYTFTPTKRDYTSITGNQINQDYTADSGSSSFSLNVQSIPDTGVRISISPNDNNGEGDGNTNFTRLYTSGTTVTLTAPVTHNGKEFSKWTIDGTDTTHLSVQVTMNSSRAAIAYYVTHTPSEIALNRYPFNFGKVISGVQTHAQTLLIDNRGGGTLNWTVSPSESWILVNPSSGTGNGEVSISVDGVGLSEGAYTGTITVSDPDASNSPQTVNATLNVYSSTTSPFGTFETPLDNSTVRGSIPVTGWALDDIGVESVKIYRKKGGSLVYIGDAVLVEGARPDVEEAYPGYPNNYKAGWGYMLLTNALPHGGNGTFTLQTKAENIEGHSITLGTKTITCDNANAVKPFGAIDTPTQGGAASGSNFVNWGWVLTPQPNTIPTDGSTIDVWVDGVNLGHPTYNIYREDIATLFPGYNNSNGAVGYFYLDTTTYENGVHTIAWSAADDAGNKDGIGSRYFSIENSHGAWSMVHGANRRGDPAWSPNLGGIPGISNIPVSYSSPVEVIKGFNRNEVPLKSYPDEKGNITIKIRELQLLEVRLFPVGTGGPFIGAPPGTPLLVCSGFHIVGSQLRPLPPGSYLDTKRGIFYWLPGPAFIGEYRFVFIIMEPNGEKNRKHITINIRPTFCDR